MRALVIVDVQYDFLPGGSLAVPDGDAVLEPLLRLAPDYECVVATQDWHPEDHGSFAATHEGKEPGETVALEGIEQRLWPVHCVQGTRGAELHDSLDRVAIEKVFRKGTDPGIDSYSGFFDNGHRRSTGLADYLRERGADAVDLAGLATEVCVRFTALDARREGFPTRVLLEACRGLDAVTVEEVLAELRDAGVEVVGAEEDAA